MASTGYILRDATTGKIPTADCLVADLIAHASFKSPPGGAGTFHAFGFFNAPAANASTGSARYPLRSMVARMKV